MSQTQKPEIKVLQDDSLREFVRGILYEGGMRDLTVEEAKEMEDVLLVRLEDKMFGAIMRELDENQLREFLDMTQQKSVNQAKVDQFLQTNLKNPEEVFGRAFEEFRSDYLGGAA
ncbi:MAG TPA: DUF5663 domain-containing protein [Patescibacteria group bacterium]|nr:DUF5663 domain-containing protein [Patescibacteria group bacterium]